MSALLHLDAAAVRRACGPADAVEAVTAALLGGLDPAEDLPRRSVDLAAGHFLLMPSQGAGSGSHVGIKVATVAPDNPGRGLPRIQASYLLFAADTLEPLAVLDGTALTTLRTPAVSVAAVRARLLAVSGPLRLVVIGAGPQAHGHVTTLRASLAGHRDVAAVTQLVRDPATARRIDRAGLAVLGSAEATAELAAADVVVCATSARAPLFDAGDVPDHAVVVAVGSHERDARELPAALCGRATVVVEDAETALREAGDVCLAIDDGALTASALVPMRDVVTGRVTPDPGSPLVFKGVGMSWQDLVVAEAVIAAAPRTAGPERDRRRSS